MLGTRVPLDRGDWLVPAALAAGSVAEVFTVDGVPRATAIAVALLACVLLLWRREHPLVAGTACGVVVVLVSTWLGLPDDRLTMPLLVLFAACFALGRYVISWWGAAGVGVVDLSLHWSTGVVVPPLDDVLWAGSLTFGPYVFGRLALALARSNDALAAQARQLVEEQRHVAEQAVADERRRIARELHDVIAHSLSVMVVQAGAAREVLDSDRATVERALEEIQRAGRDALGETGRLLGLLREEVDSELVPQPVAGDLPGLVEAFRTSGLDVRLTMEGTTDALPAGVGLSVFRIVEEGLTNALKHAPGGSVEVCFRRRADHVVVDLASTSGSGATPQLSSHGHGLVGMRERVAVFGGSLTTAPTDGGGFVVSARLPVPEPA